MNNFTHCNATASIRVFTSKTDKLVTAYTLVGYYDEDVELFLFNDDGEEKYFGWDILDTDNNNIGSTASRLCNMVDHFRYGWYTAEGRIEANPIAYRVEGTIELLPKKKKRRVKIVTDHLEGAPLSICLADAVSNEILTEVATVRPEGILRWMNAKPDEDMYDLMGFIFDEQGRLAVSCL